MQRACWASLLMVVMLGTSAIAEPELVSFDFRGTEVKTALKIFAAETGLNIVAGQEVSGTITALVQDIPPFEALQAILSANGLRYIQEGKTIVVLPNDSKRTEMASYQLQYADAPEVMAILSPILTEPSEKVSASSRLNTLTVQAQSHKLAQIRQIIDAIDTPPLQVLVEAKVIELKSGLGDSQTPSQIGANMTYAPSDASPNYLQMMFSEKLDSGKSGPGFYAHLLNGNIQAFLTVLEKTVGFTTIASPWITATNHQLSEILIGSKLGYKTSTVTATGTIEDIKFMEVGVKLKFTPHISKDGMILMTIFPSISDGSIVNGLPQETTTEVRNEVLVKNGQTIVIGGLTKNTDNKIVTGLPILSQIPLIGYLFGKTEIRTESRDLMILITPRIVSENLINEMNQKGKALEEKIK